MTATLPALRPWQTQLREWQVEAAMEFPEIEDTDRLWVVTPAGGKTLGAGRVIHGALSNDWAELAIFMVPRTPLRGQVARQLGANGLNLDPTFSNDNPVLIPGMHGAVVTYAQVASNPAVFRDLARRRRLIVVFDEVHHASEQASWGEALFDAFEHAELRLSMSGTPFRSDEAQIPFVRYEQGNVVSHYNYDYIRAISEDVCRTLKFGFFDGEAEWISRGGERQRASFGTKLDAQGRSERLRTHLLTDAFTQVLAEANDRLNDFRREQHGDAAGLIVCMTQDHARAIAEAIQHISGRAPTLVISANQDSADRLERFRTGTDPWLVAVHMVSEGIDIPRLRAGVYASNVRTEMYLRQFFGRFVRKQQGYTNDDALVILPGDPYYHGIAKHVHHEVKLGVKARGERLTTPVEREKREATPSQYRPIGATLTITSETVTPIEREEAIGLVEQRALLTKDIQSLVSRVAHHANVEKKKVNQTLYYWFGGPQKNADIDSLQQRKKQLETWLEQGYTGYQ